MNTKKNSVSVLKVNFDDKKLIKRVVPDNRMLFRFSAVTFNSHRIHYDKDYATEKESYPNLVVQGPLIACLAMNLIQSNNLKHHLKEFKFKNFKDSQIFVNKVSDISEK